MKTFFAALSLLGALASGPALALPRLVCEEDQRPADGLYKKLEVEFVAGGRANVYWTSLGSGGFAPPEVPDVPQTERTLIGENLVCDYGTEILPLRCSQEGGIDPDLHIFRVMYSGQAYVEFYHLGQLRGLFRSSSCEETL